MPTVHEDAPATDRVYNIKINDVRIGNIFRTKDGKCVYVSLLSFDLPNVQKIGYRYFEANKPVPSDEETQPVLLSDNLIAGCNIPPYSDITFMRLGSDVNGYFVYQNEEMLANVIYLHDLQNFWYVLKAEELTFLVDIEEVL